MTEIISYLAIIAIGVAFLYFMWKYDEKNVPVEQKEDTNE